MSLKTESREGGLGRRVVGLRRRAVGAALDLADLFRERTSGLRTRVRPVTEVVSPAAWVLGVVAIAAGIAAVRLDWTELWVGAWFAVAICLIAVVFVLGTHQLAANLDLSRDRVVVGERANGRLLVANRSRRRTLPATIELPVGTGRADFDLPSLAPLGEHEDLFAIPTARRAVLTVGPITSVRSDPLGLLRRAQHLAESQLLYVHPRTVRIDGSAAGMIRDLEGQTIRKLTDSDVSFHALRGYVPGDDRRYIHWKTSARTGTLMVRQFEETRRSHLLVALSTRLDDYASAEEFETAVSVAGSLGVQTLADGQTLSVATSTRQLRTVTPTNLLDQLSGVDFERQSPRLSEVVRRLAREVSGASVAMIVCGSIVEAAEIRRARRHLPIDIRTIVVRSEPDSDTTIRPLGDLHVVSLGQLDDLPGTVRRLSA